MDRGSASVPRSYPLRTLLLWLVVGILVPALLLSAVLVRRAVGASSDDARNRLLEVARGTAALVDSEISATIRTLQALAESPRLRNDDIDGFHDEAVRVKRTQPSWYAVVVLTPEGRHVLNTARGPGAPMPMAADRQSFEIALNTRLPVVGNLTRGSGPRNAFAFAVRVPVVEEGAVLYVLSAVITPEAVAALLADQAVAPPDSLRAIVDANNVIVARTASADRYVGGQATPGLTLRASAKDEDVFSNVTLDGKRVYTAFVRAPRSRWIAGVAVERADVDSGFVRSMAALSVLGLLLLGAGGGGSYLISRWIARDISMVTGAAEVIASGKVPVMPRVHVGEIRQLADALARSAELIKSRERERDDRVSRADAARAEAEAADRAKDEFLAMLSHELRNPLAPALNALHLAKVAGGSFANREREIVERQVRHMARLVDDLLEMSRLRRGPVELRREQFDVAAPIAHAVEMTAPLLDEKNHRLSVRVAPGLVVDADEGRIAQVLTNLLSNAAKYTEPGGHIQITATREDSDVVIRCQDNGIGMSPELVPRVFDLFVQGDRGIDRRQGGLGLGLAVVKTLVEMHGGSIVAESAGVGHGSRFTLRLPGAVPTDDRIPAAGLDLEKRPVSGRVLVVEDSQDARDMLVLSLTIAGFEARGVGRGSAALAEIETWQPQFGVLDIGLPDMDGFELARAIRQRPGGDRIRLVALTGYGGESNTAAADAAGFDLYLIKPVEIDELIGKLVDLAPDGSRPL